MPTATAINDPQGNGLTQAPPTTQIDDPAPSAATSNSGYDPTTDFLSNDEIAAGTGGAPSVPAPDQGALASSTSAATTSALGSPDSALGTDITSFLSTLGSAATGGAGLATALGTAIPYAGIYGAAQSAATAQQNQNAATVAPLMNEGTALTAAGGQQLSNFQNNQITPQQQTVANTENSQGAALIASTGTLGTIAAQSFAQYSSGTLTASDQAALDASVASQKAQVAQQLAAQGITDSGALNSAYQQIDNNALAQRQTYLNNYFQTGDTAYNQWSTTTQQGQALQLQATQYVASSIQQNLTNALALDDAGMGPLETAITETINSNTQIANTMTNLMASLAAAWAYQTAKASGSGGTGTAAAGAAGAAGSALTSAVSAGKNAISSISTPSTGASSAATASNLDAQGSSALTSDASLAGSEATPDFSSVPAASSFDLGSDAADVATDAAGGAASDAASFSAGSAAAGATETGASAADITAAAAPDFSSVAAPAIGDAADASGALAGGALAAGALGGAAILGLGIDTFVQGDSRGAPLTINGSGVTQNPDGKLPSGNSIATSGDIGIGEGNNEAQGSGQLYKIDPNGSVADNTVYDWLGQTASNEAIQAGTDYDKSLQPAAAGSDILGVSQPGNNPAADLTQAQTAYSNLYSTTGGASEWGMSEEQFTSALEGLQGDASANGGNGLNVGVG